MRIYCTSTKPGLFTTNLLYIRWACAYSTLCLPILSSTVATAQTSDELQSKYGRPEHGAYTISPDVRLTVNYGADRRACRLELWPRQEEKGFSPAAADRVLNDIAPIPARKGNAHAIFNQTGCAAIPTQEYSNIAISRYTDDCKGAVQSLTVKWIRSACGNASD